MRFRRVVARRGYRLARMPDSRRTPWLEALPIVVAGAAAVLYFPSLALSSTFGFVGLAIAAYAVRHGARAWVGALGIVLNVPLAIVAVMILLAG